MFDSSFSLCISISLHLFLSAQFLFDHFVLFFFPFSNSSPFGLFKVKCANRVTAISCKILNWCQQISGLICSLFCILPKILLDFTRSSCWISIFWAEFYFREKEMVKTSCTKFIFEPIFSLIGDFITFSPLRWSDRRGQTVFERGYHPKFMQSSWGEWSFGDNCH